MLTFNILYIDKIYYGSDFNHFVFTLLNVATRRVKTIHVKLHL